VSHDRAFLDNVVTSTLVFDGSANIREYVGGFDDWLRQGGSIRLLGVTDDLEAPEPAKAVAKTEPVLETVVADNAEPKKKLSYKLQRELDAIPGEIEVLETELE